MCNRDFCGGPCYYLEDPFLPITRALVGSVCCWSAHGPRNQPGAPISLLLCSCSVYMFRILCVVGVHSLGSGLWGDEGGLHPDTGRPDPSLCRFLYALRALLRTAFCTCVITMPTHLFQVSTCAPRPAKLILYIASVESMPGRWECSFGCQPFSPMVGKCGNQKFGPHPHWTRAQIRRFSFDVACVQCEYSHSHQ